MFGEPLATTLRSHVPLTQIDPPSATLVILISGVTMTSTSLLYTSSHPFSTALTNTL